MEDRKLTATLADRSKQASQAPQAIAGERVVAALVLWIVAAVVIAGITLVGARALALGWAADANETATVIVAEVYAILIAALFVVFGGRAGAASALRLRAVPARTYALAFAVLVIVVVTVDLTFILAGAGEIIRESYLRIGTDGGRLGVIGPIAMFLSLGRACLLAPIGEELLFRGAIYGWTRRWLPGWPAIALNGILWGVLSIAIGGPPQSIVNGLVLSWIRERSDSTLPGIALHIAHNTAVVIVVYVLTGWH